MLVKAEPARRAVLTRPPAQVRLWFNEEIEKDYASLTVLDGAKAAVTDAKPAIAADDPKAIVLTLPELPPGKYTVKFRVLSVDGHVVDTSYDFTVKSKATGKMIEVIATLLRWLQLASNMILVGGCVFLAIAGSYHSPWVTRLQRSLPWLGLILLIGLLGILATTTAQATGISENAWRLHAWLALMQNTRMGQIWIGRAACGLMVIAIALYLRYSSERARWKYVLCATAAVAHPDGGRPGQPFRGRRTVGHVDPALCLAHHPGKRLVWRPARLPGRLLCLHRARLIQFELSSLSGQPRPCKRHPESLPAHPRPVPIARTGGHGRRPMAFKRFSTMALPVMLGVIATGVIITDRMVDTSYGGLVATLMVGCSMPRLRCWSSCW